MQRPAQRKLRLRRQSIRRLSAGELEQVQGGITTGPIVGNTALCTDTNRNTIKGC